MLRQSDQEFKVADDDDNDNCTIHIHIDKHESKFLRTNKTG